MQRVLRDLVGAQTQSIRIDSREQFGLLQPLPPSSCPTRCASCSTTPASGPIFDLFNVDEDIARALSRRVDLKSGGYLVIDQTEALTTVDVNTGGFVGARNFDDTVFRTNLEAAQAIARQLRLRNLGGIVIVDFIDMVREDHRDAVLTEFRKQLARDRVKTMTGGFSQLGLVEMTRKRTRESLAHMLSEPCPACERQGRGQDRAQRVLRHPARNPARGPRLQPARIPRGGLAQGDRAVSGRRKPAPGGPVRLHRQADLAAGEAP
jgi:ribonuclease G